MPLEYRETIHDEVIVDLNGDAGDWGESEPASTLTEELVFDYSRTITASTVRTATYSDYFTQQINRTVRPPLVKKEITMASTIVQASASPRITNPNVVRALKELRLQREERDGVYKRVRALFASQTICGTRYKREFKTVSQYKSAANLRAIIGPLQWAYDRVQRSDMAVRMPPQTEALLRNAFQAPPYSALTPTQFNAINVRSILASRIQSIRDVDIYTQDAASALVRKMVPYVCPLTGDWLLSLIRDYGRHYTGPLQELVDAGAVKDGNGKWYRNAQERADMLQLREVLMLYRGDFVKRELPASEIASGSLRKAKDGREVLVVPGSVAIAEYHSGMEDTSYDDAPRHVGIELEVNAGKHSSSSVRNDLAAQILLATNRRVKVERDGSVTGFEVITGHGKPSSVREELAEVFRQKLLSGFRTARTTGAHVHVTALQDEARKVREYEAYYHALLPFYNTLAERTPTHHCRAGMHNGRYSALNYETGKGTIEFRLFKAQLKLPKLIRNAQFGWAFMELLGQFVPGSDDETIRNRFLEGLADLPREETLELRAWMAGRGHKVPHVATDLRRVYRRLGVSAAMG